MKSISFASAIILFLCVTVFAESPTPSPSPSPTPVKCCYDTAGPKIYLSECYVYDRAFDMVQVKLRIVPVEYIYAKCKFIARDSCKIKVMSIGNKDGNFNCRNVKETLESGSITLQYFPDGDAFFGEPYSTYVDLTVHATDCDEYATEAYENGQYIKKCVKDPHYDFNKYRCGYNRLGCNKWIVPI